MLQARPEAPVDDLVLRPGQQLSLELPDARGDQGPFPSRLDEVTEELFFVLAPLVRLEPLFVPLGTRVRVGMRVRGEFFAFDSRVQEHVFHPEALLGLDAPALLQRRDQRAYYRLPLVMQPNFAAVMATDGSLGGKLPATIVNLSGGGLELVTPEPIRTGIQMALTFALAERELRTKARAVAVEAPERGRFNYRAHCQFIDIERRTREEIVRYVFKRQIALLRAGLMEPEEQPL